MDGAVQQALKRLKVRCAAQGPLGKPQGSTGASEQYERGYARGAEDAQAAIMTVVAEELQEVQRQTRMAVIAEVQEDVRAREQRTSYEVARFLFLNRN